MDPIERSQLLFLAREAVCCALQKKPMPLIHEQVLPFTLEMGCFVTLKTKDGDLRGCIGNLWAKGPLHEQIPSLACQAAFGDPRFHPVTLDELPQLTIEISLLGSMQSIEHWSEIRLGLDGVLLTHGYHRAVFLPQVASEQGWDLPAMLTQLCKKAALHPQAYLDAACRFEVFQAEVFGEENL